MRELVEQFAERLEAVGGRAHGPLPVDGALELLVELCRERAGDAAVAVSTGDPLVEKLGVAERLAAGGLDVLTPDDVFWRERLAEAGVGVTGAVAAVAGSGTVGIACGVGAPRATSLVPPAHICLVFLGTMVEDLAEALGRCTSDRRRSAVRPRLGQWPVPVRRPGIDPHGRRARAGVRRRDRRGQSSR